MEATELRDRDSLSLSFGSSATSRVFDFGSEPVSPSGSYPTEDNSAGQEKQVDDEDDDDYVAELTRQMANYMLQDDDKHQKSWGGSGSPQSTLWSPFGFASGSPIGPSREPSPPLTPATEKFEMMKAREEMNPIVIIPFQSKQALIDDQIRSAQANFRKMKGEREKDKREPRNRNDAVSGNRGRSTTTTKHYGDKSSGYGGNQQRNGSGLKAVFLDGSGSRSGSGGTGVFLPRGTGTVLEPRKKTGRSRVIIPARVVEALKHHFEKMGVPSSLSSHLTPHQYHDTLLIALNNDNNKNRSPPRVQKRQPYTKAVTTNSHREPSAYLPPEWTY